MTGRASILPINLALVMVGVADLVSTMIWLNAGLAVEINPIMASILKLGIPPFVAVKLFTLAAYVCVMEWYRRRRSPAIAKLVGNITVLTYLSIYSVSFYVANQGFTAG